MADLSAGAIAKARAELNVAEGRFPASIGIIMDGNGRWARSRGLPRSAGHWEGATAVRSIVTEAARLGVEVLTLYSFSLENWSRPEQEVNALMRIYAEYLIRERPTFMDNNVRLRHLGRREELPQSVLDELDETARVSAVNDGMVLCLALNYGSRAEITDAVRQLAEEVRQGRMTPEQINPEAISARLGTAGLRDPDLVIRTSGEMRLSNFLLWQMSYAEIYATETHWPDFDEGELHKAIQAYAGRHRRFGTVDDTNE